MYSLVLQAFCWMKDPERRWLLALQLYEAMLLIVRMEVPCWGV